ncbi:MAG: STAS-like domain-containing protein [Verrucomicrobiaceae bacterium]|nr:STAS-like domain-containing protein [Verrucomicrobiaceae bacterium]
METRARKILDQSGLLHIIQPEVFRRSSRSDRNLPITKFSTYHEVHELSREFVELAIRALPGATHDFLTGLEWATNEVMDNVLNHADSDQGGFVQAVVLPDRIAWAVADTGQGILASLREGFPMLANDTEAVAEAVKAGVTRNKEVGQGNGLAGTLSISLLSGGTFSAHSGQGGYDVFIDTTDGLAKNRKIVHSAAERYPGTFVGSQILKNPAFRLADALGFASPSTDVFANDVIESRYESDDAKSFVVRMASETSGFGSRHAGKALRTKCLNLIRMEPSKRLVLDWAGVSVISSSYADEFVAKMVVELGFATFSAQCTLVGMVPLVRQLIDKAIFQRVAQASPYGD